MSVSNRLICRSISVRTQPRSSVRANVEAIKRARAREPRFADQVRLKCNPNAQVASAARDLHWAAVGPSIKRLAALI